MRHQLALLLLSRRLIASPRISSLCRILLDGVLPFAIQAGNAFSMAIADDGHLYAWGSNYYGQLMNGTHTDIATPTRVNLPDQLLPYSISSGSGHTLLITY